MNHLIKKIIPNQDPEWTIVNLRWEWDFVKKWLLYVKKSVDSALTNPLEQTESIKTPLSKYIDFDTNWWEKLENFNDFSGKITEVKESPDKNSCKITYKNQKELITHQLHQQTPELMSKLSTPEKILTEIFGLTPDQFMKNWKLKKWEWIKFTPEQKNKIQQLLQSQVLQLAGCRGSSGKFLGQGRYGYLWTSIPGVYIGFDEDEVYVGSSILPSCFFSAVRSEN